MKFYTVYQYDLEEEEGSILIGFFPSKANAILFVKHLINKGVEKYFDIRVVEEMNYMDAITMYENNERPDRLIATNLHKYGGGNSVFYFNNTGKCLDFKD